MGKALRAEVLTGIQVALISGGVCILRLEVFMHFLQQKSEVTRYKASLLLP